MTVEQKRIPADVLPEFERLVELAFDKKGRTTNEYCNLAVKYVEFALGSEYTKHVDELTKKYRQPPVDN